MNVRAITALFLLLAAIVAAGCESGGDGDGRSKPDAGSGSLVVEPIDVPYSAIRQRSLMFLRVDGADRWSKSRHHDGPVRIELATGEHEVTTHVFVCPDRCPEDDEVLERLDEEDGPGRVITCSTTVEVSRDEQAWWRASLAEKPSSCEWKKQETQETMTPSNVEPWDETSQHAPAMWIEGMHGAVSLGGGSSCWSFGSGPGLGGGMGCGDGAGGDCSGVQFARAPELDVRPGEMLQLHLGLVPKSTHVSLKSTVASRDDVEPDVDEADASDERVLTFAAPDADATMSAGLNHERGDNSGHACLRVVGRADPERPPTVVTGPSEHALTSEIDAKRIFYIDGSGGGPSIRPDTIACEEVDRPDLADEGAWSCTAYAGKINKGKVLRAHGIVVRDDGGVQEREMETVDVPDELLPTPDKNGGPGVAMFESAYGSVSMLLGSYCWSERCVDMKAPEPCGSKGAPPSLKVHMGDQFVVRPPVGVTSAEMFLAPTVAAAPGRSAQDNYEWETLTTTLLKPDQRVVTATARGPQGEATWYACIAQVRD